MEIPRSSDVKSSSEAGAGSSPPPPACFLIVYNVSKKHNIGTLARSAAIFGVKEVRLGPVADVAPGRLPRMRREIDTVLPRREPEIQHFRQPWIIGLRDVPAFHHVGRMLRTSEK